MTGQTTVFPKMCHFPRELRMLCFGLTKSWNVNKNEIYFFVVHKNENRNENYFENENRIRTKIISAK
jgi:hypothetical protein